MKPSSDHFLALGRHRWTYQWHWQWFGFESATVKESPSQMAHFWFIQYWVFVLPLTLLSAWLILGKRPKAKGGG